ncbi:MAG: histidinol-phosphate transaminase [Candidatus Omnitrophica bacterium CG23_combo_of_CG06-09_8_20_14_all_40_11]|nr:MAG: histidinol-phosphate transaminase [Candidatus Omnitrophica bacterium CG23_combo_of_CG06-09_8_20_14_all_40_11]
MEELVRKNIVNITPYIAGKPIEEIKRQWALKEIIKLASNENPLGPSLKAMEAIKKNLSKVNRYPDSLGFYLKKKLARYLNVKPANIVLGNGSDELIDIIIKTFVEDDENIITADTTFLEYEIISKVNGRRIITVPLRYFKYDLEAIKKKIGKKTKLIFIANPNNPTGTYVTKYEFEDFMRDLPANVLLVLDEAYDTFIDVDDFPAGLNYINNKNVIVLKTFSKAYGLAGLRIGYCLASQKLASYMEKARQPFNVNFLAHVAATAALDDKKFLRKTRKTILAGKDYLYDALSKLGIVYVPTVANFILIDVGRDGVSVFKEMLKYGVIVRDMDQYGLKNFIRVTIGTEKENERFIKVLKKVL